MKLWIDGTIIVDTGICPLEPLKKAEFLNLFSSQILGTITPEGNQAHTYPGCRKPLVRNIYARQTAVKQRKEWKENFSKWESIPEKSGIEFLVESSMRGQVTYVAFGALTNLAVALRIAPGIAGNIREVLVIDKEDNFLLPCIKQDPEAAQIVIESGIPISFILADWKFVPEQSVRLNQPGKQFSACLAKGAGVGMLIPTGMPGKVKFYRGKEETCVY